MNSKEALDKLSLMINREKCIDSEWNKRIDDLKQIIKQDLDQLEQLEKQNKRWAEKYAFVEKELVQTKKNFKNSQTHSKNCYKKLKEKYEKLEKAYKNNEVMVRDLNDLITRNLELKDELKKSQETINAWMKNHKNLIIDNGKMKKALDTLKKNIVSKKRIQSLRETANPTYEVIIHIPQNVLKEVLQDE